jgi:hypothetical protein
VGMNLKNYVRSVVYKGIIILHINLKIVDIHKG